MIRGLFKMVDGQKILLTQAEVDDFDAREVAAVERRKNRVPEKTFEERLAALEAKQP